MYFSNITCPLTFLLVLCNPINFWQKAQSPTRATPTRNPLILNKRICINQHDWFSICQMEWPHGQHTPFCWRVLGCWLCVRGLGLIFLSFELLGQYVLTLIVLNFWKFTSYCSLKPLWSGMGEVVKARTSPTPHPPSPPTVHQLSRLAL